LQHRLAAKGITALMTPETDPDQAVAAYLRGALTVGAGSCDHGAHQHHHHRHQP
jgi:predicted Fe-Mo cluster-binding NifX family protein